MVLKVVRGKILETLELAWSLARATRFGTGEELERYANSFGFNTG